VCGKGNDNNGEQHFARYGSKLAARESERYTPMIDSTSGKIELLGYEISSILTRADFLNSLLSQDAKSVVENPPYYSYSLSDSFSEKFTILYNSTVII